MAIAFEFIFNTIIFVSIISITIALQLTKTETFNQSLSALTERSLNITRLEERYVSDHLEQNGHSRNIPPVALCTTYSACLAVSHSVNGGHFFVGIGSLPGEVALIDDILDDSISWIAMTEVSVGQDYNYATFGEAYAYSEQNVHHPGLAVDNIR